jgi:hypothetical protein
LPLVLGGVGLYLGAHFCMSMADAFEKGAAGLRTRMLAGCFVLALLLLAGGLLSTIAALFVGFARAFRWAPVLLPLATAWLIVSGAIEWLAKQLVRRMLG